MRLGSAGLAALVLGFAALGSAASRAETYPDQTVHLIVAFPPGGPADIIARIVGNKLQERWKQTVVVENKAGGGGNIAARQMLTAPPDGLRILVSTSAYAVNATLQTVLGYDARKAFIPAGIIATTPNVFVTAANSPIKTFADIKALAAKRPLTFGSAGTGTTPHLTAERLLRFGAHLDATHVNYPGAGPAVLEAIAGHIDMACIGLSGAAEFIKGGQLRGLAIAWPKRADAVPNVPTTAEFGLGAADDATWVAFFLPAATPPAIAEKLNADINAALADSDVTTHLANIGFQPIGGGLADAKTFVLNEIGKWGGVVTKLGLHVD